MSSSRPRDRTHSIYEVHVEGGATVFFVPDHAVDKGKTGLDGEVMAYQAVDEQEFNFQRDTFGRQVHVLDSDSGMTEVAAQGARGRMVKKLFTYRRDGKYLTRQPGFYVNQTIAQQREIARSVADYSVAGFDTTDEDANEVTQRYFAPMFNVNSLYRNVRTEVDFLNVAIQVAYALDRLHKAGHVHGDFKDYNACFLGQAGSDSGVVMIDFGMSLPIGESYPKVDLPFSKKKHYSPTMHQTRRGDTERLEVSADLDLYSYGCFLYDGLHKERASAECIGAGESVFGNWDLYELRRLMHDYGETLAPSFVVVIAVFELYRDLCELESGQLSKSEFISRLNNLDSDKRNEAIRFCISHSQDQSRAFKKTLMWMVLSKYGLTEQQFDFVTKNIKFITRMTWLFCGVFELDADGIEKTEQILDYTLPSLLDANDEFYQMMCYLHDAKLDWIHAREIVLSEDAYHEWMAKSKEMICLGVAGESKGVDVADVTTSADSDSRVEAAQAYALAREPLPETPEDCMTEKSRRVLESTFSLSGHTMKAIRGIATTAWQNYSDMQRGFFCYSNCNLSGFTSYNAGGDAFEVRRGDRCDAYENAVVTKDDPPEYKSDDDDRDDCDYFLTPEMKNDSTKSEKGGGNYVLAHESILVYKLGVDFRKIPIFWRFPHLKKLAKHLMAQHPAMRPSLPAVAVSLDTIASLLDQVTAVGAIQRVQELNFPIGHVKDAFSLVCKFNAQDSLMNVGIWLPFAVAGVDIDDVDLLEIQHERCIQTIYDAFVGLEDNTVWVDVGAEVFSKLSPLGEVLRYMYELRQVSTENVKKLLAMDGWQVMVMATLISGGDQQTKASLFTEILSGDDEFWLRYQGAQALNDKYDEILKDEDKRPLSTFKKFRMYEFVKGLVYKRVIDTEDLDAFLGTQELEINGSQRPFPGSRSVAQQLVAAYCSFKPSRSKGPALELIAAARPSSI